ncbi:hypothetical protein [Paenibacillus gallinarum]|uniref:Uncharacterized protein n=1 Tax=Paenibacillus gallinarum TaxID=2762232 RepID=A0ABR8T3J4_9BACL|nr:hypothetical protein [Paenibacillus gallinarum]MBD7970359.1 hypothetical protein [Paenibacillus gallinarum]
MGFKSVTEETTRVNADNVREDLQSRNNKYISQLDPFLLEDYCLAIDHTFRLEIMNNLDGKTVTYILKDALIDIDAFVENMLLPLKLKVEINGSDATLDYNISRVEAVQNSVSFENPKYYIYCDNSNEIGFRFWFLKNK